MEDQQGGLDPEAPAEGATHLDDETAEEEAGAPEAESDQEPAENAESADRERACMPGRATKRAMRRQWRRGVQNGRIVILVRSIPEDPDSHSGDELFPDLEPGIWDGVNAVWAEAELALANTFAGSVLGARVGLAPVRGRFRHVLDVPGFGAFSDPSERFRDPARCLAAARTTFAADVLRETTTRRAIADLGIDCATLRAALVADLERLIQDDEDGTTDEQAADAPA